MEQISVKELHKSADTGINIYEIKNAHLRVIASNLGCHILSIYAPDREGRMEDIVLGYQNVEDCRKDNSCLGAIVGRVANRIGGAAFTLNGRTFTLAANAGENHLHGGLEGFDRKLFSPEILADGLRFTYVSPDGEEGYPGTLTLQVEYLLEGDRLHLNFYADTDKDTILNITAHTYFNLSAGREKIYGHQLQIMADRFAAVDKSCLPTGERRDVAGTPFDFRQFHEIGERISEDDDQLKNAGGYDHAFFLKGDRDQVRLYHAGSGRLVSISTTLPTVQVYSANYLAGGAPGKGGKPYENRDGVALETQYMPDSIHREKDSPVILRAGESYRAKTTYRFSVR